MADNTTAPSDNIINGQRLPSELKDDVDMLTSTTSEHKVNDMGNRDKNTSIKALPSITDIPINDDPDVQRHDDPSVCLNPSHIKDYENFSCSSIDTLKKGMGEISKQCNDLRTALLAKDTSLTDSVEDLFNSLKVLSHNQSVLENKLDDVMKNQVNTDIVVNNLNERLNKLSTLLQNTSKVSNSNLLIENSSNSTSSQHNTCLLYTSRCV